MDFSLRSLAKNYDALSFLTGVIGALLVTYSGYVSSLGLRGLLLSAGIVSFISSSDFSKLKNREVQ